MIGAHLSGAGGIKKLINNMIEINANVVQLYVRNPRKIMSKTSDFKNLHLIKKYKIFTHSVYGTNLCIEKNFTTISTIVEDLKWLKKVNGVGTVVHVGSSTLSWEECKKNIIVSIKKIIKKEKYGLIILENQALAGNKKLLTSDDILSLWNDMDNIIKKRVAFCIDTCHLFVTEKNKLNLRKEFLKLDKIPIALVHLNDSNSRTRDIHDYIYDGLIPKEELNFAIKYCKKYNIPMVIEMYKMFKKVGEKQALEDHKNKIKIIRE
jgi:endonuclease IV